MPHRRPLPASLSCARPPLSRRGCLRLLLAAPAAAALSACGGSGDPSPVAEALDAESAAAVADGLVALALGHVGLTGGTVSVAGRRRQGRSDPATAADRFPVGSCTKAMTCATVLALAAQGGPSVDTPLSQAFAAWADDLHPALADVTLGELLHHRGALPDFSGGSDAEAALWDALQSNQDPLPTTLIGRRQWFSHWLLSQPPVAGLAPGRDYSYSNAGYIVVAAALEALSGESFEALFQRLLLQPLGLSGAWRSFVPRGDEPLWGHEGPAGQLVEVVATEDSLATQPWLDLLGPAGLWSCPASAHARWLHWHLRALTGQNTPLPPAYVAGLRAASGSEDYSWGWVPLATPHRLMLTHDGHTPGFQAETVLDRGGDFAAFALSNTAYRAADGSSWVAARMDQAVMGSLSRLGVAL